jgi:hypothetical protein
VEEVIADVVEIARELEVKLEDVTELLQSHDKTSMDEQSGFLRWNFLLVNIVEITTKDL